MLNGYQLLSISFLQAFYRSYTMYKFIVINFNTMQGDIKIYTQPYNEHLGENIKRLP